MKSFVLVSCDVAYLGHLICLIYVNGKCYSYINIYIYKIFYKPLIWWVVLVNKKWCNIRL